MTLLVNYLNMIIEKIYNLCASLARMCLYTKFATTKRIRKNQNRCIVLGNGPSLNEFLRINKEKLAQYDKMAVNFMALSEEYVKIKPNSYVLCDPVFWFDTPLKHMIEKVNLFYQKIVDDTTWPLDIYMTYNVKKIKKVQELLSKNTNIRICYYNKTRFDGVDGISHFIYKKQWGVPRTQNVIVAALMLAIYGKYEKIFLAGAENDWIKRIWVDKDNNHRTDDQHFYKENKDVAVRISSVKLHNVFLSFFYAFRSYVQVAKYADSVGIKIYNLNELSFIDAFEKKNLC